MLILTRRINESITIAHPDGDITVTLVTLVTATRNDRAQLGIIAPLSVDVYRTELGAR